MNAEHVLMRLGSSESLILTKEDQIALKERVNFLEGFVSSLLASIRGKRINVKVPPRKRAA